jgi:3-deoxy-D-manno-octulosonate 8-phosphate phosphatase (KDO 8-P phosphatase)
MTEVSMKQCMHEGLTGTLVERIKPVLLLILDVDGVMTDGRIIIDDTGRETKSFNVKDGHGIKMLMKYGIDVAIITGRKSAVVEHRAGELGITEVHQHIFNKREVFNDILKKRELKSEQVAFIGDDIVDIPVLKRVGFAVAVADATDEVKTIVHYITKNNGGNGAVREICDLILKAQGKWGDVAQRYDIL